LEEASRRRSRVDVFTPRLATATADHEPVPLGHLPKLQEGGRNRPAGPFVHEALPHEAGGHGATKADELEQAILQARDWPELDAVPQRIDAAYQAGQIDQEQAERLAAMAGQEAQCLPEEAGQECLSDLFRDSPVSRVRSRVLGEDVLVVADGAEIPADNELPDNREAELRQVIGRSPEQMRAIHAVKQAIDGEVVEGPGQAR
jgi:hypothetical protein